jgi:hypothetical protein
MTSCPCSILYFGGAGYSRSQVVSACGPDETCTQHLKKKHAETIALLQQHPVVTRILAPNTSLAECYESFLIFIFNTVQRTVSKSMKDLFYARHSHDSQCPIVKLYCLYSMFQVSSAAAESGFSVGNALRGNHRLSTDVEETSRQMTIKALGPSPDAQGFFEVYAVLEAAMKDFMVKKKRK